LTNLVPSFKKGKGNSMQGSGDKLDIKKQLEVKFCSAI